MSYANSATGSRRIMEISTAFVEVWFGYDSVWFKEYLTFLDNWRFPAESNLCWQWRPTKCCNTSEVWRISTWRGWQNYFSSSSKCFFLCYVFSQVKTKSSLIILKPKQSGKIWRKVVKQKYPGAVQTNNKNSNKSKTENSKKGCRKSKYKNKLSLFPDPEPEGDKLTATWKPAGDYTHLKVSFLVQSTSVQVYKNRALI